MAKGNPFIGKTSGSVGDITTYGRGAVQVVRRRAREVKNPRTPAQTLNRVIASTIGQAYSRMSSVCDHSFQGYSTKAENMARFFKENQQAIRKMLANSVAPLGEAAFLSVGQKGLVGFPFIVSQGSLPSLSYYLWVESGGANSVVVAAPGITETGGNTYQAVCNALGLQRGDEIAIVYVSSVDEYSASDPVARFGVNNFFNKARIVLDPRNADGSDAPMTSPIIAENGGINLPNPRNEMNGVSLTITSGRLVFVLGGANVLVSAAAIVSRKDGGLWLRSAAALVVSSAYSTFPTLADAINSSYPATTGITDPTKFLNAALALKV